VRENLSKVSPPLARSRKSDKARTVFLRLWSWFLAPPGCGGFAGNRLTLLLREGPGTGLTANSARLLANFALALRR
jgi:hypothetical protein